MALCKLGSALKAVSDSEDTDLLLKAVSEKDVYDRYLWSAKALSNALNSTNYPVGATIIKEHRRLECVCYHDNNNDGNT